MGWGARVKEARGNPKPIVTTKAVGLRASRLAEVLAYQGKDSGTVTFAGTRYLVNEHGTIRRAPVA